MNFSENCREAAEIGLRIESDALRAGMGPFAEGIENNWASIEFLHYRATAGSGKNDACETFRPIYSRSGG